MKNTPSLLGGILLVVGNVIGAGILALPVATAQLGLPCAIVIIFLFWLLMMLGAYYFLEANLALPAGANLISMSHAALGKWGVCVAWVCNLLVMYSLISAYIAGGGDLIKTNLQYMGITLPTWVASVCFLVFFGFIVSLGIHITDHANRVLMITKAVIFGVAVVGISTHFNSDLVAIVPQQSVSATLLIIVITSFGFATLIPSLRSYYQSDIAKIKKIIFWGTLIPLICYVLWIAVVFSVVPYAGANGLAQMATSNHPVSALQLALSASLHSPWITQATNMFSAICIITSFLANSISLTDFLADGLALQKNQKKSAWVYVAAYLPAIAAVLFYPKAFLAGLSIAGTLAIIQLLILPGLIVWFLRYSNKNTKPPYSVIGGKFTLLMLLGVSFTLLFFVLFKG
jgi:tyrosine-specific transport protein